MAGLQLSFIPQNAVTFQTARVTSVHDCRWPCWTSPLDSIVRTAATILPLSNTSPLLSSFLSCCNNFTSMKFFALAMFFALMQAGPPIPRKAPDNPAPAATNVKRKSATSQTKPLPAQTPAKTDSNGSAKRDGSEHHSEDPEHTVGISKLPPVSVTKDWADWGVWVFSGLLVLVGFLQVWLLYGTL